jgi:hypothetical protein
MERIIDPGFSVLLDIAPTERIIDPGFLGSMDIAPTERFVNKGFVGISRVSLLWSESFVWDFLVLTGCRSCSTTRLFGIPMVNRISLRKSDNLVDKGIYNF